jgi:hypothetical protein
VTPTSDVSSLYAHLEIGKEGFKLLGIAFGSHKGTIEILLTSAFLEQKVISTIAFYRKLARTGLFDPFFSAAMTLLFRHRKQFIGKIARFKQNLTLFTVQL